MSGTHVFIFKLSLVIYYTSSLSKKKINLLNTIKIIIYVIGVNNWLYDFKIIHSYFVVWVSCINFMYCIKFLYA